MRMLHFDDLRTRPWPNMTSLQTNRRAAGSSRGTASVTLFALLGSVVFVGLGCGRLGYEKRPPGLSVSDSDAGGVIGTIKDPALPDGSGRVASDGGVLATPAGPDAGFDDAAGGSDQTDGGPGAGGSSGQSVDAGSGGANAVNGGADGANGGADAGSGGASAGGGATGDPGTCVPDADCTCEVYGTSEYRLCVLEDTYAGALASCEALGMTLVRVDDQAENDWLLAMFTSRGLFLDVSQPMVLLGGTDAPVEGEWRWSDGEVFWNETDGAVLYENWWPFFPKPGVQNDCVGMLEDGTWAERACTSSGVTFACESRWW